MEGKTTVINSHIVFSVKNADEIIVLENGMIAVRGAHNKLMCSNTIYRELYEKQMLEEESSW